MRMARAKRRDMWDHTANLLALLINVNRDPKKSRPATAEEIHPFSNEHEPLTIAQKNALLKEQFATLRVRAFGGKATPIAPFTPINADKVKTARSRAKSNGQSGRN